MNKPSKILAYIRVSKDDQDVQNQELEIRRYCDLHNLKIADWIKIEISSRKNTLDRRIEEVLAKLQTGNYAKLIVTEASRLSRTIGELLYLFEKIETDLNVEVIETKEPHSHQIPADLKLMRRIFAGYFAEQERRIISLRTKEALQSKKQQGIILGKPTGTIQNSIYDSKLEEIKLLLSKAVPITIISKIIGLGKPLSLRVYLKKRNLLIFEKKKVS